MNIDEALQWSDGYVATSTDSKSLKVLADEVRRLRSLFGSFQLECCDDWTCAEEHARNGAAALHEARAANEKLVFENEKLVSSNERLRDENVVLGEKASEACDALREIERVDGEELAALKAENAELVKKLECKRVRIEAMQANWSAERERTEADRQSADKLRANIAETQLVGAMEELDWFRRRDELVDRIKAATNLHAEALAVLALIEWEEKSPKPGAGT